MRTKPPVRPLFYIENLVISVLKAMQWIEMFIMEKVILYYSELLDMKISMEIYFTEKGQLFFDGCDYGKSVKEIWGDFDYEYTYTIEPDQVEKLYEILSLEKGVQNRMLQEIKKRFSVHNAYSLFGIFLDTHKIKYEKFTWI